MNANSPHPSSAALAPAPILSELDRLESSQRNLQSLLADLTERLSPVLRPGGPCDLSEVPSKSIIAPSPLAARLDERSAFVRSMCRDVEDLLSRLEL